MNRFLTAMALAGTCALAHADTLVIDQAGTRTTYEGEMTGAELLGSIGYGQFLADSTSTAPGPGSGLGSQRTAPTGAWSLQVQTDAGTEVYPTCALASLALMGGTTHWRFVCRGAGR